MTPEAKALLLKKSIDKYASNLSEQQFAKEVVKIERNVRSLLIKLEERIDSKVDKKDDGLIQNEITKITELISRNINSIKEVKLKIDTLDQKQESTIKLADDTESLIEGFTAQLQVIRYKIQQLELKPELSFESDNIDISDKIKNNKRIISFHAKGGGEKVTLINSPGGGNITNTISYPDQTGKAGQYLSTNGTTVSWALVAGNSGGLAPFSVTTYTNSTNLPSTRQIARGDTSGASITLTLPGASANIGLEINIKKVADQNTLTINDVNNQLIDGVANAPVYVNGVDVSLVSFGGGWDII